MKLNEKTVLGIGFAAGAAAAVIPAVIGLSKFKGAPSLFNESSVLRVEGNEFVNKSGERFIFKLLAPDNMTLPLSVRSGFNKRFGSYGAAQLVKKYEEAFFTVQDLDFIRSIGFNSVMLTFGHSMLFNNGKLGKSPDFSRLNELIDNCSARGLRAVIHLNDSTSFAAKEKPAQNLVDVWKMLAEGLKGNAGVAAFKLTLDDAKMLKKAAKAIRKADPDRMLFVNEADSALAQKLGNCALIVKGTGIPGTSLPAVLFIEKAEDAVNAVERGKSVAFFSFKEESGKPAVFEELTLEADNDADSYDDLQQKYALALVSSACRKNEDICRLFSSPAFSDVSSEVSKAEPKQGFGFNVGLRSGSKMTVLSR